MNKPLMLLLLLTLGMLSPWQHARGNDDTIPSLTTISGQVFRKVRVSKVNQDGISVSHEGGVANIPFEDLPKGIRDRFKLASDKDDPNRAEQENKVGELKKSTVWILGKIVQITSDGILVRTAQDHEIRRVTAYGRDLGVTPEAEERYKRSVSSLPADLRAYLAKGGDLWASKMGREFVAENWIRSIDDYERYFSLQGLFTNRPALEALAKYPPVFTEDVFFVHKHDQFADLVDESLVSIWVIPAGTHRYTTTTGAAKTVRAFNVAPPPILNGDLPPKAER